MIPRERRWPCKGCRKQLPAGQAICAECEDKLDEGHRDVSEEER